MKMINQRVVNDFDFPSNFFNFYLICFWFVEDSNKDDAENDEDDDDDEEDDGDDYTPAKAYHRKDLDASASQPKRKRGRPRKYKTKEEAEHQKKIKHKNWRDGKIFKCPYCVKTFTRRHRVSVHIGLRHGFECAICNLK